MTDILQTRLNHKPFTASSCSWSILGAPFVGILKLDYGEKRERKLVHASRKDGRPVGIGGGKYSVDGLSMTMLRSSFQRLIELLAAAGFGSYGDAEFPIIAKYHEPLSLEPPIVVAITGCVITGAKDSYAEGIDELVTDIDMMALELTRNGIPLYSVVSGVGQ